MLILILFLFTYVSLIYHFIIKSKKYCLNASTWLALAWLWITGLYFVSGISYGYKVSIEVFIYLFMALTLYFEAYWLGSRLSTKCLITLSENQQNFMNMDNYYRLALFGISIWFLDVIKQNVITFGQRINDYTISFVGVLGVMMSSVSLIIWLNDLAFSIRNNVKLKTRTYISLVIYLVPNVIMAGRQSFLIFLITTVSLYCYLIKENKMYVYKKKINLFFIIFSILVVTYFTFIATVRIDCLDTELLYEKMFSANISNEIITYAETVGIFKNAFLQFDFYYSHEIPMFAIFYDNYYKSPLCGFFQLHYISRRLPESWGLSFMSAREVVDEISYNSNTFSAVYRTCLRCFIIDFGRVGALIFIFIVGFLMGQSRRKHLKWNSIFTVVVQSVLCAGAVFSIEYSPLYEFGWAYPFYWLLLIQFTEYIKMKLVCKKPIYRKVKSCG